ncbi:MAG: RNA polymerase sigma factor [Ornithinimicrobium sp.]|uniref:RNA polymerase sigma factor n=1 Tax=Ornithinimicrobium sp. TaxID=1977084 RepID=UPI003D9B677D
MAWSSPNPASGSPSKARDSAWFDTLFTDHATAVHRYFVRRAPAQDCADLSAEVFAVAWRRRAQVPAGLDLPWLYKTASFVLANHRRKPVLTLLPDDDRDAALARQAASADPADLVIEDNELRTALMSLRPRERQVLMMHAWEGLDGTELAAALGMSRGGAAAALSRARRRFRNACGD